MALSTLSISLTIKKRKREVKLIIIFPPSLFFHHLFHFIFNFSLAGSYDTPKFIAMSASFNLVLKKPNDY